MTQPYESILEAKLESLQKHAEDLQSVIEELLPYKEMFDNMLSKTEKLAELEYDIKKLNALETEDPQLAVDMIRKG